MDAENLLDGLNPADREVFESLRNIILQNDKKVTEGVGKIMSVGDGLCFTESGVFKYGIVRNKDYYSFHSMVLYASENIMKDLKSRMKKPRFQKGCVNFKNLEDFPPEQFREHIKLSAAFDFSVVISYYSKRKSK